MNHFSYSRVFLELQFINFWSSIFYSPCSKSVPLIFSFRLSLDVSRVKIEKRDRLISKPLNLKSFFFLFDPTNFVHYIYTSQWWCVALYPIHKGKSKWNTITVQLGNSIKEATTMQYTDMLATHVGIFKRTRTVGSLPYKCCFFF